jgi:hypothetical protein
MFSIIYSINKRKRENLYINFMEKYFEKWGFENLKVKPKV